jgi:competence protein ComGC
MKKKVLVVFVSVLLLTFVPVVTATDSSAEEIGPSEVLQDDNEDFIWEDLEIAPAGSLPEVDAGWMITTTSQVTGTKTCTGEHCAAQTTS